MKQKAQILVALLFIPFVLYAQTLDRYSFNPAGDVFSNEDLRLSITIGQAGLVGLLENPELSLYAGFQQLNSIQTTAVSDLDQSIELRIFPNPFVNTFQLAFSMEHEGLLNIQINNTIGQTILKEYQKLNNGQNQIPVEFKNKAPGIYFVYITIETISGQLYQTTVPVFHSQ